MTTQPLLLSIGNQRVRGIDRRLGEGTLQRLVLKRE
jgi:hypothetical protein